MKRFLRETWELWYWAMFCPTKLQQRMNQWAPAAEKNGKRAETKFFEILLFRANLRFLAQYFLLLLLLSLPLALTIYNYRQPQVWLLLPIVVMIAYGTSSFFLPIGLNVPFLLSLNSLQQPGTLINVVLGFLPQIPQLTGGLAISTLILILSLPFGFWLIEKNYLFWARNIITTGGTISIFLASWLATKNIFLTLVVSGVTGLLIFRSTNSTDDTVGVAVSVAGVVAGGVAVSVAFGVTGVVAGVVAGIVTGVLAGAVAGGAASDVESGVAGGVVGGVAGGVAGGVVLVAIAPLPLFLPACWLIAFSLSPTTGKWLGIITSVMLTTIGFQSLELTSLWAIPVTLLGYYRLLPDYLILTPISLFPSLPILGRLLPKPLQILRLLPPYSSELLWLPLPNHDRLLTAAFHIDETAAVKTFQQMQASPLPGLQDTIKQALPQIVADQLFKVSSVPELLLSATAKHPLLSLLMPSFYQSETELEKPDLKISSPVIQAEISIIFPRLQAIAKDVDAALKAGNAALRERGLERILNQLERLQLQLPGLGLKAPAIKRWKPVLERWERVIYLELEEQQKQSQGELLNPFLYGNPLKSDRAQLFKGRQIFADNIYRLILDRNRPTLVLHGPRRCGKSSFLLNLPHLLPSDMLPVYVDLQSAAITTDEAAFCYGLVRNIHRDSRSQGVVLPTIPSREVFRNSPYIALEDWLEQVLFRLGERRLLLNLDEFEKIGSAINQGRISLNLFDELRHLIQHYDKLGFLFSGVQTLDELGPNWSSYFISVVPIEMVYLQPHEAEDLLINPDPEFTLRYEIGIVAEILTFTRCHPYLLQLIGSALVTQANLRHTQLVTSDLLQAAITDSFTLGEPYFTNVWTEFTGTSPIEIAAGQELLLALSQGHQPNLTVGSQSLASLQRLLRYHVIEKTNGGYSFEVPLMEEWVRLRTYRN